MTFFTKLQQARNFSRMLSRWDAFRLAFASQPKTSEAFRVKGLKTPVHLRPGTLDLTVFEKIFLNREYELPFAITPHRIVDAGAHVGLASRFFAHRYPLSRILAIEPMATNLEVLRRNAAACQQIDVYAGALWGHTTTLASSGDASWAHAMREAKDKLATIASLTIPEILTRTGWDRIDLLKLDVEGAEREIFCDGAAEWLPRVRVIVLELHDRFYPGCSRAFYREISARLEAQEIRGENVFVLLRA